MLWAWDKENTWSPCQDLNLLPPEHQAGALSTNLDSVSLSFIENKAKYSNTHQISLKHYTETKGFLWQAFSVNLFNLSLCVLLSFANDEINNNYYLQIANMWINIGEGLTWQVSKNKYHLSWKPFKGLRGFNGQRRVVTIKSTTFLRSTKLVLA